MKRLKVIHYGIAHDHSAVTMECVRKYPDLFEVVGVCEPDEAIRQEFGGASAYAGLPWLTEEEIFARDDIDCALIESFELRSLEYAEKCVHKGWHVHLDKPAGTDIVQFERILSEAKQKGLVFQLGYMYRQNPAVRYVLEQAKTGKMGTITAIDGSMGCVHPPEKREWLKQFPGGMMFYLGCHFIDLVVALKGVPDHIYPFNKTTGFGGVTALDNGMAVLEYPDCTAVVRCNATEINGYYRRHLTVCGTEQTLEIRPMENPTRLFEATTQTAEGRGWEDCGHERFPGFLAGRYDEMLLDFARYCRGETDSPWSYSYEARLQRIVLAACGCPVDFQGEIRL